MDVIETLIKFCQNCNDCAEDGDRGRADDFVSLRIQEDGSGQLIIGNWANPNRQVWFAFESTDELYEKLKTRC